MARKYANMRIQRNLILVINKYCCIINKQKKRRIKIA